jgi:hypothetical protein
MTVVNFAQAAKSMTILMPINDSRVAIHIMGIGLQAGCGIRAC